MKESKYNIIKPLESGEYLVFNTFNGSLSIFKNKEDYKKYNEYLTDIDELEYLKSIRAKEEKNSEYAHYTIFMTTACNARCDYCFEKDFKKTSLTKETIDEIIQFIKNNSINNKHIHVEFFGGEPLLYFNNIKYISKELIDFCKHKKIKYTSNIITNASLLSKEIVNELKGLNVVNIQVTLDGTKKEYEKRKNYIDVCDSYELVLSNIEYALKNKINVSIRINFDKKNFDDIISLLDNISYLNKYSSFNCYVMPIYSSNKKNKDVISRDKINDYFEKVFFFMIDKGYIKSEKYFRLNKISNYCNAVRDNSYVFYPNGDMFKCTHLISEDDLKKKYSNIKLKNRCNKCKYLPLCQGGCVSNKNENSCSTNCYIYRDSINAVLNSILKMNNINDKIKEK